MKIVIPGQQDLIVDTVLLDLNGTVSIGGVIVDGVASRIDTLKQKGLRFVLITGDTRGDASLICEHIGADLFVAGTSAQKAEYAVQNSPQSCIAIGNGRIDMELMGVVALGIVTLQTEGVYVPTMLAAGISSAKYT